MLLEKVRTTIERHGMLSQGDRVLVAVSGGVDSVVLLDALDRLRADYELALHVAHLDHGLRAASGDDARFVRGLCAARGVPVTCERIDVGAAARERGVGVEEAGHTVRSAFLNEIADRIGANRIALGHTLNDRAETVLFHLVRGAGPAGLVGIRPVSGRVVRPLIEASRDEILGHAREASLAWHEDPTNADPSFSRNFLRHRVLPLLEQMNPRAIDAVGRTARLMQEEEAALGALLDAPWEQVLLDAVPGAVRLRRDRLSRLPGAIQGLLLRRGLLRARGGLQGITYDHLQALRRLAAESGHGRLTLPGLAAHVDAETLVLGDAFPGADAIPATPVDLGVTAVPALGVRLELELRPWDGSVPVDRGSDVELADADRVRFPLVLRGRRPGDRFSPLGLDGHKRLKDFLIDEKVPYYDRETLPLLCDRERIVWVVGVRLSEAVRVTPQTRQVLVMRKDVLP
jgi:tRNA(Ile)-lysidine synthase